MPRCARAGDHSHRYPHLVPVDDSSDIARRSRGGRRRTPGLTDAILEATIALAAEGSLDELTLDAVAAKAGVGRPTIYRRWPSKEALREDAMLKIVDVNVDIPQDGHIREQLVAFARENIRILQGPLHSYPKAWFNIERAELGAEAVKRQENLRRGLVRKAIERGDLRQDTDPLLMLESIASVIWYRVTVSKRPIDSVFAEKLVDFVLSSWLVDR